MVLRLRWLLLAIVLVYGWWTPGISLLPAFGAWSPTTEGVVAGFLRILSLADCGDLMSMLTSLKPSCLWTQITISRPLPRTEIWNYTSSITRGAGSIGWFRSLKAISNIHITLSFARS